MKTPPTPPAFEIADDAILKNAVPTSSEKFPLPPKTSFSLEEINSEGQRSGLIARIRDHLISLADEDCLKALQDKVANIEACKEPTVGKRLAYECDLKPGVVYLLPKITKIIQVDRGAILETIGGTFKLTIK